jgi:hypothetical protein
MASTIQLAPRSTARPSWWSCSARSGRGRPARPQGVDEPRGRGRACRSRRSPDRRPRRDGPDGLEGRPADQPTRLVRRLEPGPRDAASGQPGAAQRDRLGDDLARDLDEDLVLGGRVASRGPLRFRRHQRRAEGMASGRATGVDRRPPADQPCTAARRRVRVGLLRWLSAHRGGARPAPRRPRARGPDTGRDRARLVARPGHPVPRRHQHEGTRGRSRRRRRRREPRHGHRRHQALAVHRRSHPAGAPVRDAIAGMRERAA